MSNPDAGDDVPHYLYLMVPFKNLHRVKQELLKLGYIQRGDRVFASDSWPGNMMRRSDNWVVPTDVLVPIDYKVAVWTYDVHIKHMDFLKSCGLSHLIPECQFIFAWPESPQVKRDLRKERAPPKFSDCLPRWINTVPKHRFNGLADATLTQCVAEFPKRYVKNGSILFLPELSNACIEVFLKCDSKWVLKFWAKLAEITKSTSIACLGKVPIDFLDGVLAEKHRKGLTRFDRYRIPTVEPIYGDWGARFPESIDFGQPSQTDLAETLWCYVNQFGISQVYAPRFTMFSRGNVNEKNRIYQLVKSPKAEKRPEEICAVDLYAGIGYFSFMYAKAGVARVLGFDISGWSAEGFRRGCVENKWPHQIVALEQDNPNAIPNVLRDGHMVFKSTFHEDGPSPAHRALLAERPFHQYYNPKPETRLFMFHGDNKYAADVVGWLRQVQVPLLPLEDGEASSKGPKTKSYLPPVMHVNCGMLPTSRDSWGTAVHCLDVGTGGIIHIHENIKDDEKVLETATNDILEEILKIARLRIANARTDREVQKGVVQRDEHGDVVFELAGPDDAKVTLVGRVVKVKNVGPGVAHFVHDVSVKWPSWAEEWMQPRKKGVVDEPDDVDYSDASESADDEDYEDYYDNYDGMEDERYSVHWGQAGGIYRYVVRWGQVGGTQPAEGHGEPKEHEEHEGDQNEELGKTQPAEVPSRDKWWSPPPESIQLDSLDEMGPLFPSLSASPDRSEDGNVPDSSEDEKLPDSPEDVRLPDSPEKEKISDPPEHIELPNSPNDNPPENGKLSDTSEDKKLPDLPEDSKLT
ncbi:hypothetical protein K402DRAFT_401001 [Aulographum hederae CBS 113979]|uniref:tRNA(Phe) (4-demethylwyosine(37)-C(7)) aminocarboxypropyltransferase n=1 Tax=Aulographum hederae CBS 113979 TaxID=1176131 RepID=A0A6G1HCV3_9PEZI|nr:hypothetical protein K402DRAFT_401001 [Aulographum hederae CBS 113979]